MQFSPANTRPAFGKSKLTRHVQHHIENMPLKTYQKLKRTGVRVLGVVGVVKGAYSLTVGYIDEYQSGLHMNAVGCAPKVGLEGVVDNILPWLPCHISFTNLLLLGGALVAMAAPKQVLYISADLKERIPNLAKQGAQKAKTWANKLRRGL